MGPTTANSASLMAHLHRAASAAPERPALETQSGAQTYGETLGRALSQARGLERLNLDRFGCVLFDPSQALSILAAASAVGAEPCVLPSALAGPALDKLLSRLEYETVLTDRELDLDSASTLTVESLSEADDGTPHSESKSSPLLILTTGTTGAQKGVRHDWRQLSPGRSSSGSPGTKWLLTYNLNQFAGIQVLLHTVISNGTLVLPSSNGTRDAIEVIVQKQVTHVSATPTFWRLLIAGLTEGEAAELPLAQITLGGEAADQPLLDRLASMFPAAKVCHVYAGTEFGSAVAVCDGLSGLPLSVTSRDDDAAVRFRICGDELEICSSRQMLGYHGAESSETQWRKTGDLVEVRDDRIHFVGRTSDIINVGGAKVHPLPVEEQINGVSGVLMSRVYGRPNPITGSIVAAQVVPRSGVDQEELRQAVRAACEGLPRAARPRRIEFVENLETRGQKLVRMSGER